MAIEQSFAGKAIPMATDTTLPTVEFRLPLASALLPSGTGTNIQVLATDNEYLTKVTIAVNGTIKCTKEQPDSRGAATGDYTCGYAVPKGAGKTYTITATGYDQAGNTTSASVVVTSS
jgi:Tfp pilus assembly protein PilX